MLFAGSSAIISAPPLVNTPQGVITGPMGGKNENEGLNAAMNIQAPTPSLDDKPTKVFLLVDLNLFSIIAKIMAIFLLECQ